MRKRILTTLGTASFAVLFTGMTLAGQTTTTPRTPPTPAQMATDMVNHLTKLLTLTTDQQTQAITIFTAEETTLASFATAMQTARTAVVTAVEANDTAGIATAAAQIGSISTQQVEARGQAEAAFYLILTSVQQPIYAQLLTSGPGPGGNGGPRHGGPPPGDD